MRGIIAACVFALVFSPVAFAHHTHWHRIGVKHNKTGVVKIPLEIRDERIELNSKDCRKKGTCELKRLHFLVEDYELPPDLLDPSEGDQTIRATSFMASLETTSVDALNDFMFVQFIRGCAWKSAKESDGSVVNYFGIVRRHLGVRKHFIHPDWTVDANETDPASTADGFGDDWHYYLQWTDPPKTWFPDGQGNPYGEKRPTIPRAFITDVPEPGGKYFPTFKTAENSSLEFRMCLYKTSDVPKTTDGTMAGFGDPIHCYEWKSSHVFDHDAGKFTSPATVHDMCRVPMSEIELKREELFRELSIPLEKE